jgi:hypothetical protein
VTTTDSKRLITIRELSAMLGVSTLSTAGGTVVLDQPATASVDTSATAAARSKPGWPGRWELALLADRRWAAETALTSDRWRSGTAVPCLPSWLEFGPTARAVSPGTATGPDGLGTQGIRSNTRTRDRPNGSVPQGRGSRVPVRVSSHAPEASGSTTPPPSIAPSQLNLPPLTR